jgi:hypothetical protein
VVPDIVVTVNPISPAAVCVGGVLAPLTVTAINGTPSLTYQWYSNTTNSNSGGTSLGATSGAQTNSFTPSTLIAGTTYYYCVVSASGPGCGSATSTVATVVIVPDITILTQPTSPVTICVGGTTTSMSIIATNGTPSLTYQWQYFNGSTWSNVVDGTPAGSVYTGATGTAFSVTGINASGTYQYQCLVSASGSGCATEISSPITVTVVADPSISVNPLTPTPVCVGGFLAPLTVTAINGTPSFTYQWYSNTTNVNTGGTNLGAGNGAQTNSYTPPSAIAGTLYIIVL